MEKPGLQNSRFCEYRRFTRVSIDRLIDHYGCEFLWKEHEVQKRIHVLLELDKRKELVPYFKDRLRYYALKNNLAKCTGYADRQLLENGPIIPIPDHKKAKEFVPDQRILDKQKGSKHKQASEASLAGMILHDACSRFTPRYRFTCTICDCREFNGNGYRMPGGEYMFICHNCMHRLHITEFIPKVISVPMGGLTSHKKQR